MINFARAGGTAAAVFALAATASFADPSQATQVAGASQEATYLDHANATIGTGVTTPAPSVASITANVMRTAQAAVPRPRSLPELVDAHATPVVADAEQDCLANAVYFEARGEPIEGQLAVAEVVLNRAASGKYPASICGVVTQPWQFSFVRRGVIPTADRSSAAWRKAVAISKIALHQLDRRLSPNVLWYHADYVAPVWGKRLARQTKIGLHIFYS